MDLILENAQLVDVETGLIRSTSILIKNGIINKIALTIEDDPNAKRINLKGKYIIPGLIDMHVHIKELFAPFFTAAGVTTVRNTGGNVCELQRLIQANSTAPTPRIISADRIIDGPPGLWGDTSPWSINVETIDSAKKEVRRQIEVGADFIKVYGLLTNELIKAVVEEAKKYGKEVSADLIHSPSVPALDAAELGVKWFEHASGVLQTIYPEWTMQSNEDEWEKISWDVPDRERIRYVCESLLKYEVILCPTLVLYDQQNKSPCKWEPEHELIQSIYDKAGSLTEQWGRIAQYTKSLKRMGIQTSYIQAIVNIYASIGGRVVAGTDTPAGVWTFPGMALHRELELLVEAGFSPLNALRAATIHAAGALKRRDLGVIKNYALADIVVLEENPLEDIKATQKISFVIKGGQLYTANELIQTVLTPEEVEKRYEQFISIFRV